MHDEERSQIVAFQAGDRKAFDLLYRQYAGRVLAFALRVTGNRAEAEDLTQEVFVAAYRGAGRFLWCSSLLSWLFSIALRRHRDLERRPHIVTLPLTEECAIRNDGTTASMEQNLADRTLDAILLQRALDSLDPTLREAFLLVGVQGLTHREAAEVIGRPIGTIKWRVAEATRRLRTALSVDVCDGEGAGDKMRRDKNATPLYR